MLYFLSLSTHSFNLNHFYSLRFTFYFIFFSSFYELLRNFLHIPSCFFLMLTPMVYTYSLRHRFMLRAFFRMNYDDFFPASALNSISYVLYTYNPISINPFLLFSIFLPTKKIEKMKNAACSKRKRMAICSIQYTQVYLISIASIFYHFLIMQRKIMANEKNTYENSSY